MSARSDGEDSGIATRGALPFRSAMEMRRLGHAPSLSISLLMVVILPQALVTIPAQFRVIPAISLGGFMSLAFVVLLTMHFLMRPYVIRETRWPVFMFMLFIAWIAFGFIYYRLTVPGLQNTVIIVSSLLAFLTAAQVAKSIRAPTRTLVRAILAAIWIPAVVYVLAIPILGFGHSQIIAPRSLAGCLLIGIAIHCGYWRHGSRADFWLAVGLYAVVVMSLSRAAMGIGVVVFILSQTSLKSVTGLFRALIMLVVAVAVAAYLVQNFEPLRARFFTGDLSAQVGGVPINTMGRIAAWTTIIESALESPWVGKGPASSNAALHNLHAGIEHPHNDYLRLWHDYGVVGIVLWFGAMGTMMLACNRQYGRFKKWGAREVSLGAAATLAQTTLLILMLTDNVLVYFYNMVPIFILSGLVLGSVPHAPLLRRSPA